MCVDVRNLNLAWPWNVLHEPWKQAEQSLLEMSSDVIDHMTGVIVGAEFEGIKQALKIVSADLRIELVEIEHLGLLNLCSSGQRFEDWP